MRTPQYEQILQELEAGERESIARKVFGLLEKYPKGMTRQKLIFIIFNRPAEANLVNDTADRKIRATISAMRKRLIPIVSTSGGAGYRLDDSDEARRDMLMEMIKRRDALNDQIKAASMAWHLPTEYQEAQPVTQGRLL